MAASSESDPKLAELSDLLREIRERVRERHPDPATGGPVRLADTAPLLHARDAALGKSASIGKVNPRPGGLLNSAAQAVKRAVSRGLHWHVREQVEFNRAVVAALDAAIGAIDETNRSLVELASQPVKSEVLRETGDLRAHWVAWRGEWERKLGANETQFLRGLADLQGAFQHRATLMESNYRDMVAAQHRDFEGALERSGREIQGRLWEDLEKIQHRYETIIHSELRLARQRASALAPEPAPAPVHAGHDAPVRIDYLKFAEKFRGSEEYVRRGQEFYVERFAGRKNVLDLGCGRGEFLELMREHGTGARGIEQSEELAALCRAKGLDASAGEMFEHLRGLEDQSLDGIFCSQVVEHLPPYAVPELIRLAHAKLAPRGLLAVETPNPECLAIFATHFYLDPTHTRPVPPALLAFYFEESGFGRLETHRFAPAEDSIAAVKDLPESVRQTFFGSMDYAVLG